MEAFPPRQFPTITSNPTTFETTAEDKNWNILADESSAATCAEALTNLIQSKLDNTKDGDFTDFINTLQEKIPNLEHQHDIAKIALDLANKDAKALNESGKKTDDSTNISITFPLLNESNFSFFQSTPTQEPELKTKISLVIYLKIASKLGNAEASYRLAKIVKEKPHWCLLPKKYSTYDDRAIAYAKKAQRQGDNDALFNLGELYSNTLTWSALRISAEALTCYECAAECGHAMAALKAAMLCGKTNRQHEKESYSEQVLKSDDKNAKLALAEWILSGNLLYENAWETQIVNRALKGIQLDELDDYPKLKKWFSNPPKNEIIDTQKILESEDKTAKLKLGEAILSTWFSITVQDRKTINQVLEGIQENELDDYPKLKTWFTKSSDNKTTDDNEIPMTEIKHASSDEESSESSSDKT